MQLLLCVFFFSCSTTKYIPEGQYLLEKISLKADSTEISKVDLLNFIRQKPNSPKIGLQIYNWVENDSNLFKKLIRKIGEPPVIYSQNFVNQSVNELAIEMKNLGFLNSRVHAVVDTSGKKVHVDYHLHEGIPYRIRNYDIQFPDSRIDSLLERTSFTVPSTAIRKGTIFEMSALEQELTRVSHFLRNRGYYALTTNCLHFVADTALLSNQVDLTLMLRDTTLAKVHRIEKVKVFSGYDFLNSENYTITDSTENKNLMIYYDSLHFLRPGVIAGKVAVRPGRPFRERAGEATYSAFQALSCVGRVEVAYKQGNYPDSTLLDCEIYLTPGDVHSLQTGLDGTNKAGDLGLAVDVTYDHRNLFNGSELFNIRLKGAYEFVSGKSGDNSINPNFYEFGITPSLTFPKLHLPWIGSSISEKYNVQTRYSLGFNIQQRPEYTREFFNFNWQFRWSGRNNILTHTVSLLDVNYVSTPWKSDSFQRYLDTGIDPLTKYSYENVFTAGVNYGLVYTNAHAGKIRQRLYTVRFNAESSGNAMRWIFSMAEATKNDAGQYKILGNPFAQYVKADLSYSGAFRLDQTSGLAFRAALGTAYPYKNARILPFEKRYFAGGPNSVRGWHTRYLGPGAFNSGAAGDPTTHVGDISLIVSAEYRYKVLNWLEPAFFADCGNVWTIRDYLNQPGGLFRWDSFYKELAIGTGIGLRFDLSFLILRLDAGTRVYDPAYSEGNRWVLFKENLWRNSAAYVAIGYPF